MQSFLHRSHNASPLVEEILFLRADKARFSLTPEKLEASGQGEDHMAKGQSGRCKTRNHPFDTEQAEE
jgi:hypothetical protein